MSDYWFAAAPSKQERSRISLNFGLARADRLLRERVEAAIPTRDNPEGLDA
jgi:hypothetical protein